MLLSLKNCLKNTVPLETSVSHVGLFVGDACALRALGLADSYNWDKGLDADAAPTESDERRFYKRSWIHQSVTLNRASDEVYSHNISCHMLHSVL